MKPKQWDFTIRSSWDAKHCWTKHDTPIMSTDKGFEVKMSLADIEEMIRWGKGVLHEYKKGTPVHSGGIEFVRTNNGEAKKEMQKAQ